jgi:hypothetical protein
MLAMMLLMDFMSTVVSPPVHVYESACILYMC